MHNWTVAQTLVFAFPAFGEIPAKFSVRSREWVTRDFDLWPPKANTLIVESKLTVVQHLKGIPSLQELGEDGQTTQTHDASSPGYRRHRGIFKDTGPEQELQI